MSEPPIAKVCIIGDGGTGKTTFCKRLITGEMERKYVATIGAEVRPIRVMTTKGPIVLQLWVSYDGSRSSPASNS